MQFDHILLGAEKQAATSMALAYPDRKFLFVTDQPVVDGWDLDNVSHRFHAIGPLSFDYQPEQLCLLNERWLKAYAAMKGQTANDLESHLTVIEDSYAVSVLTGHVRPKAFWKKWIVKGNWFHKPDQIITGNSKSERPKDDYGCELIYQEYLKPVANYIVTGNWQNANNFSIGAFRIHRESVAREDLLVAGETVVDQTLIGQIQDVAKAIAESGFFTFNVIEIESGEKYVTSWRPVPKAVFQTMQRAGADMLKPEGQNVAAAGHKFIGDIVYNHYQALEA